MPENDEETVETSYDNATCHARGALGYTMDIATEILSGFGPNMLMVGRTKDETTEAAYPGIEPIALGFADDSVIMLRPHVFTFTEYLEANPTHRQPLADRLAKELADGYELMGVAAELAKEGNPENAK